jgi:hypothetical protein
MNTAELKLELFRKLDTLEKSKLEQVYGILMNFFSKDNDLTEWNNLSKIQQQGLLDAIKEMDNSEGLEHQTVIEKFRKKYV